ncbi:EboA domain-containing protein [Halomonas sp. M20]|uniref:EboA domain-containing protein n=1 Tax=Halomonas sp. M20 TaxID=2763264 RepID=UPI001D09A1CD|nr:EboA domain-containing protein [Halomonas sp. M20]
MSERSVDLLRHWILRQAKEQRAWFEERVNALTEGAPERELHTVMGLAPRLLGKEALVLSTEDLSQANSALEGWRPEGLSLDGAARIVALTMYRGERPFAETFKDLRRTADARELVALYRGLPLYPEPESLAFEVGEGLRSNMLGVFEAITQHNPYPRMHFDEHRWNHMILKALFVDSSLANIVGLDERANPELARQLLDHIHERWAAGRTISPEVWRCIGPYAVEAGALDEFEKALSGEPSGQAAAALALADNPSPQAKSLLAAHPEAAANIAKGQAERVSIVKNEVV